jgi:hypothetical protein
MAQHSSRANAAARKAAFNISDTFGIDYDFETATYAKDLALLNESDPVGTFSVVADRGEFLVTLIDGGGDAGEIINVADAGHGGILTVTTNDADNDAVSAQLNGEMFAPAAGRKIMFTTRLKIADVSITDWAIGLAVADTDILGGVADSIMFRCPDSTGDIDYVVEKSSTETTADTLKNISDATYVKLGFQVVGTTRVEFYVDDAVVANVTTNIPDDVTLSPFFTFRNSSAAVTTASIDYIKCVSDR